MNAGLKLLVYTALPGSESHDKLHLRSVIGSASSAWHERGGRDQLQNDDPVIRDGGVVVDPAGFEPPEHLHLPDDLGD